MIVSPYFAPYNLPPNTSMKSKIISIPYPKLLENGLHLLKFGTHGFLTKMFRKPSEYNQEVIIENPRKRNRFNLKKALRIIFPVLLFIIIVVIGKKIIQSTPQTEIASATQKPSEITIEPAIATTRLNRSYQFSLRDSKGKEVSTFMYILESADLRREIIVQGKRATSVKGRIFFILNLKIVNSLSSGITLNSRDYVRLSVNNSAELLAPDIHNDPVEAQAISTKYTRLGFATNDTDRNHTVQVGEITGKKESIQLKFYK